MIKCICNDVRSGDKERYHLIGTKCGKCISTIETSTDLGNRRECILKDEQQGTKGEHTKELYKIQSKCLKSLETMYYYSLDHRLRDLILEAREVMKELYCEHKI